MVRSILPALVSASLTVACATAPPYYDSGAPARTSGPVQQPDALQGEGAWARACRDLLGIRYRYGGASTSGFDCSGLVQYIFARHDGRQLPRTVAGLYRMGERVRRSALQPGDLVFYNTSGNGPSHVGIYIGDARFVHASRSRGVEVTALGDDYYAHRYLGARRL